MQQLRDCHSPAIILRALRFLSIRLKSRPQSAEIELSVTQARAKLIAADEAFSQALEERVAASAEVHYLDGILNKGVADVAREALAQVKGDRNDARYMKLFAVSPSTAMRPVAGEAQERYVQNIISRLAEDASLAPLKSHADMLKGHLAALNAAVAKRQELYVPEAKAAADRRIAADEARRIYNQAAARLALMLGNDRALIDSFFFDLSKKSAEDESAASDEAAAT